MITPQEAAQETARDRSDYQQAVSEYVGSSLKELEADLSKMEMPKIARIAIDHCLEGITLIIQKVEE